MKLRRLTLHGFKSFADRTELRFHEGITAIVGPNGSGKSNISDAVRWVLGEQRASAIRSARMDETIFQGTATRRRLGRAEVELVFSNEDRRLGVPYDEVEIRRVVFREGGSEYELNRSACRLRDILDVFRDTGLGADAYSVIEQGMVDAILSDRNEERRNLFEEAAGVGRYKDRRAAAQRRLEAAEADLARLADVIIEVDSKVRALGRQRRRAERYAELRRRRLAVELRLAQVELGRSEEEREEVRHRLEGIASADPAARAALSTTEAALERRRLESADASRERNAVAARAEEVGRAIAARERELAVAEERRTHAERRLTQIGTERTELLARRSALEEERAALDTERRAAEDEVRALAARLEAAQALLQERRQALLEARREDERLRGEEEELSRKLGSVQAEAAGADVRAAELRRRLERVERELLELTGELGRLEEQGEELSSRVREMAAAMAELELERDGRSARVEEARAEEAAARQALMEAEGRASLTTARLAALEGLEREFHGFAAPVAGVLAQRADIDGLMGAAAELLELGDRAGAVEAALNSVLQILVVRDEAAAGRVRRVLRAEGVHGVVALLRQEALPQLQNTLAGLEFAGQPPGEPVIVGRRERIAALQGDAESALEQAERLRQARSAAAQQLAEVELQLRGAEERLQLADRQLRRGQEDGAANSGRRQQVERARQELEEQRAQLLRGEAELRGESDEARATLEELTAAVAAVQEQRSAVTRSMQERESAWDAAREEEAEVRVSHARADSGRAAVERRLALTLETLEQTAVRSAALDEEEEEHRAALGRVATLREETGSSLSGLFKERDEVGVRLRALDEKGEAERGVIGELEVEVRRLRGVVDETAEQRHRLELRRAEVEAAMRATRERLEAEWGRPYVDLLASADEVEGGETEPAALEAQLGSLAREIERLGPVNLLAVEEYDEERKRLGFLTTQRDDLVRARDELDAAIRQINRKAREVFLETFGRIRENFRRTFAALFEGGECDVRLADEDDPLESDIEISASPRGKRTLRIHQLSGGERALVALALLFAIYLVKPSPFCILDEVDAPLDEANIDRFLAMLERFKEGTQFIVVTHNPRTMEAADWIYGVTMEEVGVSSIVGVRIGDLVGADGA
jgi:chromosome segregation protein